MSKVYFCIDLKTFFASVECVERNLDPFKTDLVVADNKRGRGTICLAISPKMKARGIRNRCRFYEIPVNVKPIIAKPRMKKYIEYSANIYEIYLKYFSKDDIHVYSIDEAFIDVTNYLKLYEKTPLELATMIIEEIYHETGITATAGIGTNLYLTKIALDITAKHVKSNIGYLDEEKYKEELWHHKPLTDFWQVGKGIQKRLEKYGIYDMYDLAHFNEQKLYKEFGINAKILIDHAWGIEPCTIKDIKAYKTKDNSISSGQVLFEDYNYIDARKIVIEMVDSLTLELVRKGKLASSIYLYIGYANDSEPLKISKHLIDETSSFSIILKTFLNEYDKHINKELDIRRINIGFGSLTNKTHVQLDLFGESVIREEDEQIEGVINSIKDKFGKNSLLRAISYDKRATQRERNKLIGGHNAE